MTDDGLLGVGAFLFEDIQYVVRKAIRSVVVDVDRQRRTSVALGATGGPQHLLFTRRHIRLVAHVESARRQIERLAGSNLADHTRAHASTVDALGDLAHHLCRDIVNRPLDHRRRVEVPGVVAARRDDGYARARGDSAQAGRIAAYTTRRHFDDAAAAGILELLDLAGGQIDVGHAPVIANSRWLTAQQTNVAHLDCYFGKRPRRYRLRLRRRQ